MRFTDLTGGFTGSRKTHANRLPNRLVDRIPPWMRESACRFFLDLPWFVDDYDESASPAVRIVCGRCNVRRECLAWALERPDDTSGAVYGGLTPLQRRQLELARHRVVCPGCGSDEVAEEWSGAFCFACGLSWKV